MSPELRAVLLQIHLWTGLTAGIFFVLLGLSGSVLVYPDLLQSPTPVPKATAQGTALPLEQIIAAARDTNPGNGNRSATVSFPRQPGDAIAVQFNPAQGGGARGRPPRGEVAGEGARGEGRPVSNRVYVDPVSGAIVGQGTGGGGSVLVGLARQMHEAMLLGGFGRTLVAWLGVGMLFLGLSGLYLWWPRNGQWRYAFGVRSSARGFRLYREIHGMVGIWFWLVFIFVTVTSIPLGFSSVMAMIAPGGQRPQAGFAQAASLDVPADATALPLADLIQRAEQSQSAKANGLVLPARADRPVTVSFGAEGPPRTVTLNPYSGDVLGAPQPASAQGINRRTIEQLHGGEGLGPVWRFLVFLSGFLPTIFVVTGLMMWLKKRSNRQAA